MASPARSNLPEHSDTTDGNGAPTRANVGPVSSSTDPASSSIVVQPDHGLQAVEVSLSPKERFNEYLQSRGMRNTEQRRLLVDIVCGQHDHFDADDLIEKLPRKSEKGYVSRPTVYRTLAEFVDAGLLRKFELEGRAVYELDYGYPQHDHLHCKECSKLIEFQSDELFELRRKVAELHNFQVESHRLIINGVCEDCRRKRRRVKRKVDLI